MNVYMVALLCLYICTCISSLCSMEPPPNDLLEKKETLQKLSDETELSIFKKSDPQKGEKEGLPRHFRIFGEKDLKACPSEESLTKESKTDFSRLSFSGSAQFSQLGLKTIVSKVQSSTVYQQNKCKEFLIVNLRAESYFMLGQDKVKELELNVTEGSLEEIIQHEKTVQAKVSLPLKTEEEIVLEQGISYCRFPIMQGRYPTDHGIDRFVLLMRSLPLTTWVHFHCRGGNGRTTTAMAMYEMMRCSQDLSLSLKDLLLNQHVIGGTNLFSLSKKKKKAEEINEHNNRLTFLTKFFDYIKDPNGYTHATLPSWSKWLIIFND